MTNFLLPSRINYLNPERGRKLVFGPLVKRYGGVVKLIT